MNGLNNLLFKLKKIIDLNLSPGDTLSNVHISSPDSLDSVYIIGQKIFDLNNVEVRIWKNSEGYHYHKIKQNFLDLDDFFKSEVLENELDYENKIT